MLEEYEHRDVAYRVLHGVLDGNRVVAYFYRIWGLLTAMKHLGAWGNRVSAYLLEMDRRNMSAEALRASRVRERDFQRAMRKHYLPQLLRAFRPGYDPARDWPEPSGMREFMQRVERQYAIPGRAE